jgi:glucosamine-6-phosphate deaminase
MVRGFRRKELDFDRIQAFILDEFVGLAPSHPKSFYAFMRKYLFQYVNIREEHIHYLDGSSKNMQEHCIHYEQQIKQYGGIDLQILGIGRNGHVGFNEPGSSLSSRTRVAKLLPGTLGDNRSYFGSAMNIPQSALTMGVGTILEAKHIMLLATGFQKAEAVAAMIEGPLTSLCPASSLQMHPHATVICDEEAAMRLKHREMYEGGEYYEDCSDTRK